MYKNLPDHYVYPAIIETTEDNYCLYYPDLPGCVSTGNTIEQAVELGKEAAKQYLWDLEHEGEEIPAPTSTKELSLNAGDTICIVDVNMFSIRAKMDHRTVKKTLTIPWYLNELAEAKRINFSRVLREALQAQVNAQ